MKPLTRILIKIQDLIGKIIVKLEPPQPFHSLPLPEFPSFYNNTISATYENFFTNNNVTEYNIVDCTFSGSAGTNTYTER